MLTVEIENKYKEVELNIFSVKNKSYETSVNEYLDMVNLLKRQIVKATISVNELNDMLFEKYENDKLSIYNEKDKFKTLLDMLQSVANHIKQSEFYKGLQTVMNDFNLSISNLQEITDDTIFYFDAKNDKDFESIFSKIANA